MSHADYQKQQIRDKRVWLLSEIERHKFEIVKLESQVALLDKLMTPAKGQPDTRHAQLRREIEFLGADLLCELPSAELAKIMKDKLGIVYPGRLLRRERQRVLKSAGVKFYGERKGGVGTARKR